MSKFEHSWTKAAFISNDEDSGWFSLRRIHQNILDAYRLLTPSPRLVSCRWRSVTNRESLANSVRKGELNKLIFLGSNPRIRGLERIRLDVDERIFHVFGDFTRITPEWFEAVSCFVGKPTKFITASEAQRRQLLVFLGEANQRCVDVVPFSMNWQSSLKMIPSNLNGLRSEWGFAPDDFVITYGGRVSQQKNVNLLLSFVKSFIEAHPRLGGRIKVAIAGGFDDIGQYFVNQYFRTGEFSERWTNWFQTQPAWFKKQVCYLGFLTPIQLENLYAFSGAYASLSTFHDEDFGMAPLEALGMGCPAILSGWGGYSDFAEDPAHARLVPVRCTQNGLALDYQVFEANLLRLMKGDETDRHARAKYFRMKYSLTGISQNLKEVHHREVHELSPPSVLLQEHASRVRAMRRGQGPVFKSMSSSDSFYKKIYRSYLAV